MEGKRVAFVHFCFLFISLISIVSFKKSYAFFLISLNKTWISLKNKSPNTAAITIGEIIAAANNKKGENKIEFTRNTPPKIQSIILKGLGISLAAYRNNREKEIDTVLEHALHAFKQMIRKAKRGGVRNYFSYYYGILCNKLYILYLDELYEMGFGTSCTGTELETYWKYGTRVLARSID